MLKNEKYYGKQLEDGTAKFIFGIKLKNEFLEYKSLIAVSSYHFGLFIEEGIIVFKNKINVENEVYEEFLLVLCYLSNRDLTYSAGHIRDKIYDLVLKSDYNFVQALSTNFGEVRLVGEISTSKNKLFEIEKELKSVLELYKDFLENESGSLLGSIVLLNRVIENTTGKGGKEILDVIRTLYCGVDKFSYKSFVKISWTKDQSSSLKGKDCFSLLSKESEFIRKSLSSFIKTFNKQIKENFEEASSQETIDISTLTYVIGRNNSAHGKKVIKLDYLESSRIYLLYLLLVRKSIETKFKFAI